MNVYALIRPHLEYMVRAWDPYLTGVFEKLVLVQRRSRTISKGFENMNYNERLRRLNLTLLKNIRIRGNLIEMF